MRGKNRHAQVVCPKGSLQFEEDKRIPVFPLFVVFDYLSDFRPSPRSIFCTQSISYLFLYSSLDLSSCHLTCS